MHIIVAAILPGFLIQDYFEVTGPPEAATLYYIKEMCHNFIDHIH